MVVYITCGMCTLLTGMPILSNILGSAMFPCADRTIKSRSSLLTYLYPRQCHDLWTKQIDYSRI